MKRVSWKEGPAKVQHDETTDHQAHLYHNVCPFHSQQSFLSSLTSDSTFSTKKCFENVQSVLAKTDCVLTW